MQRKPGFPVANCSIKMPDNPMMPEHLLGEMRCDEDNEQQQKRQQLINFGHSQWGFNNWSWSVNKQELDFVDFTNGRYCAGVVAFVSITVKSFDIHRENIGYATTTANTKGFAIYKSRKCAVTNALRETLLSFGGSVASDLTELLESTRADAPANAPEPLNENNQNVANKQIEPKNMTLDRAARKDSSDSGTNHPTLRSPHASAVPPPVQNGPLVPPPAVKNAPSSARVLPTSMPPANRVPPVGPGRPAPGPAVPPPGPAPQPAHPRPNSNVSFVLQPVVGALGGYGVQPMYGTPRVGGPAAPHVFPNAYYEYPGGGGWHFAYESYERPPGNVNLNFNLPPKNLVVNGRGACRPPDDVTFAPPPPAQGCWIKPTIFYDGFWTEQKVKKWVAEQVEKQFPEDASAASSSSPDKS
ncbi:DNA repair and recombination protein rhm52-like isoform X1 [Spodoptera litura]|uniref:DNA repair and recombination protein rhm52-like isoform X1 n=2 Tax=Spodoptera litura TaxID=69820 RepID=A0A9J7IX50_SPOLT|nr:DNA repair and recombination protein rhm52-like isoform X1 [Spodoptera litura]